MRDESTRALHAYWSGLKGGRVMPERDEIEPSAIRPLLQDLFILGLERDDGGRPAWRYRLAGTRVCALAGGELKGGAFARWWETAREGERLAAGVANDGLPLVAGVDGQGEDGRRYGMELLLLPLGHEGFAGRRVIGGLFGSAALRARPEARIARLRLISARTLLPGASARRRVGDFGMARADDPVGTGAGAHLRLIRGGLA
jgi:hypothetical protein